MAFSEIELKRCEKALAQYLERRRPPAHLRDQIDLSYRIEKQSVEIFEIRPDWQDRTIKRESPVAKATYVQTKKLWKIFWMRQDLKWHGYQREHPKFMDDIKFLFLANFSKKKRIVMQ